MKSKKKYLLVFVSLFFTIFIQNNIYANPIDKLHFITENYPPYNFKKDDKLQGISVEILSTIFRRLNSKQTIDNIEIQPWARGYYYLLNKKETSLFSTTRTKSRENLFKWVGPIISTTISIIAKKEDNIKIDTIKDILKYKTCVNRDDVGEQVLIARGIERSRLEQISGIYALPRIIKMLNKNRCDIFAYEQNVAMWEIKNIGLSTNDYEIVFKLEDNELFYAFHIDTSNQIINELQGELNQLKSETLYKNIINKYLDNNDK